MFSNTSLLLLVVSLKQVVQTFQLICETGGVEALYNVGCIIAHGVFYATEASDGGTFLMRDVRRGSLTSKNTNVAKDFGPVIY